MSQSILGCSRLAIPFSSAATTLSIGFSPRRSLPYLRHPLDRHRHRRLQLLGEELHPQLLEHPAELLQARIGLAGSRLPLLRAGCPAADRRAACPASGSSPSGSEENAAAGRKACARRIPSRAGAMPS